MCCLGQDAKSLRFGEAQKLGDRISDDLDVFVKNMMINRDEPLDFEGTGSASWRLIFLVSICWTR